MISNAIHYFMADIVFNMCKQSMRNSYDCLFINKFSTNTFKYFQNKWANTDIKN